MKLIKTISCIVAASICMAGAFAAGPKGVITVGYAQVGAESDWRTANTESFKSTFTKANGYKLIFDDAQQKQENQIKAIRNFINRMSIISSSLPSLKRDGKRFSTKPSAQASPFCSPIVK